MSSEEKPVQEFKFEGQSNPNCKWYIVQAFSGNEKNVRSSLTERIKLKNLGKHFSRIEIPEVKTTVNKNGKKTTKTSMPFPGYVLVQMEVTNETWHVVKGTNKVVGFLGGGGFNPKPISEQEAATMLNVDTDTVKASRRLNFSEGDVVTVTEGSFVGFTGVVDSISDKGKVKLNISVFGRTTSLETESSKVEKAS